MIRCFPAFIALLCLMPTPVRADDLLRNLIDREIDAAITSAKITPSPLADDAEFLRRVYLDLIGIMPTAQTTQTFLDNTDPQKRQKTIDRLLDDPRFAEKQATVWDLVLFGRNPQQFRSKLEREPIRKWLVKQFAANVPYDQWVRELLAADGNTYDNGAAQFLAQYRADAEDTIVSVSRIFLGTQLQCARCHDHPREAWTQKDFYGMAAFYSRLIVRDRGKKGAGRVYQLGEKRTGEVMFTGPAAEQTPGKKGVPIGAKFLGGADLKEPPLPNGFKDIDPRRAKKFPPPDFSRKQQLAKWLTAAENPYFARAAVNRLWGQFLRRGLVHPVDNLKVKNTASHPRLLEILEKEFVAHKFDLKWFIRELLNSKTYQRSSKGNSANPEFFEQARLRPLSAEEMLASLRRATGFDDYIRIAKIPPKKVRLPSGLETDLYRAFANPTNGEGEFQASLTERLFVNNNSGLRQLVSARNGNLADRIAKSKDSWEKKTDALFLAVLSRLPSSDERRRFTEHLSVADNAEARIEEAIWVLVASAEFRFNH